MIIVSDPMVKLGLSTYFKHRFLKWYGVTLPMKEPRGLLGKSDLTHCEIREGIINTAEPDSSREANERFVENN